MKRKTKTAPNHGESSGTEEVNTSGVVGRLKSKTLSKASFATVISSIALIVSVFSAYENQSARRDVSGTEMIQRQFGILYDFSRLEIENWQMSHMFAQPEWYEDVSRSVAASVSPLDSAKQAELLIKERAIARIIFTHFEESLYQSKQAKNAGDTERANFEQLALDYYTENLLRNPRLLYMWSKNGGKLDADFEQDTRKYYEDHVLHNTSLPLLQSPDLAGPFATKQPEAQ